MIATLLVFLAGPPAYPGVDARGQALPPGAVARLRTPEARRLEFSPDGRLLAMAWPDGIVEVWEVAGRRMLYRVRGHAGLASLAFSSDGKRLATGEAAGPKDRPGHARVWEMETGKKLAEVVPGKGRVATAGFLAGGRMLVTYCPEGRLRWWDVGTGKKIDEADLFDDPRLLRPEAGREGAMWKTDGGLIHFAPDEKDKNDRIQRIARGEDRSLSQAAVLLPGGRNVLVQYAAELRWHVLPTGRVTRTLELPAFMAADDWALSQAGDAVAAAKGGEALLMSPLEEGGVHVRIGVTKRASALAFTPDGRTLAVADENGLVIWDVSRLVLAAAAEEWLTKGRREAMMLARREEAGHLLARRMLDEARYEERALRVIPKLNSDSFDDREEAVRALAPLLPGARAGLIRAIDAGLPAEVKRNVRRVLGQVGEDEQAAALDEKRPARLAAMLRRLNTPETMAALRALARMDAAVPLAAEARRVLEGTP